MTTEREVMLARIRQALKTAVLPNAAATLPPYRGPDSLTPDSTALIDSFTRELQAVGGEVFRPATGAEACEVTARLIKEAGGNEVLAWPDEELPLPGIGQAFQAAGLVRVQVNLSPEAAARQAQMADLDRPLVGLTGALAGLADTGALALLSGPARSRAASLLPLTHVALLATSNLYPSMAAFLAAHTASTLIQDFSNLVFITGPSRTGDIEMVITRGVHGPKRLVVVLVPPSINPDASQ